MKRISIAWNPLATCLNSREEQYYTRRVKIIIKMLIHILNAIHSNYCALLFHSSASYWIQIIRFFEPHFCFPWGSKRRDSTVWATLSQLRIKKYPCPPWKRLSEGGAVASCSSLDWAVWGSTLAGDIVLCSWKRPYSPPRRINGYQQIKYWG